jgi:hypothetical protein
MGNARNDSVPEDDVRFVGTRQEVERLQSRVREQVEEADTDRYQRAAELFARILECDAVDAVLELTPGTTRRWANEEEFVVHAAYYRARHEMHGAVEEDFGRALEPRQRAAARLLAVEHLTQTETAARVGVDRRTIFNWNRRPPFSMYKEQLESKERERLNAESHARRAEVERDLQDVRTIAVRKAKDLAEEGDPKLIAQVLAKLL